jgi:hypothetical protein
VLESDLLGGMDRRRSRPGSCEGRCAGEEGEIGETKALDDMLTNFLLRPS